MKYLLVAISAALVNNVVLVKILGVCPVVGTSRRMEACVTVGLGTTFAMTLIAGVSYFVEAYVLEPFGLEYLRTMINVLVLIGCSAFTEIYVRRAIPEVAEVLGIHVPLSIINCAALAVPLLILQERYKFVEALFFGFGSGIGFLIVMVMLAGLRDRLEGAQVPASFRGDAILLVTAGLLSLGFMGFNGLVK